MNNQSNAMTSLRNLILSIPVDAEKASTAPCVGNPYKIGHRDARNAAAELALAADQLIVDMCLEFQEILDEGIVNSSVIKQLLIRAGEPK